MQHVQSSNPTAPWHSAGSGCWGLPQNRRWLLPLCPEGKVQLHTWPLWAQQEAGVMATGCLVWLHCLQMKPAPCSPLSSQLPAPCVHTNPAAHTLEQEHAAQWLWPTARAAGGILGTRNRAEHRALVWGCSLPGAAYLLQTSTRGSSKVAPGHSLHKLPRTQRLYTGAAQWKPVEVQQPPHAAP